jgi:hypothetical protein
MQSAFATDYTTITPAASPYGSLRYNEYLNLTGSTAGDVLATPAMQPIATGSAD